MKLFQQLLVAPAALGLMAPIAASAAELNINDVSDYSASSEEVKSISDFSDVYPTDWAYKALNNLRQRHGCAVASPSGSMTRYEAAALLNKCLETVVQVSDEEQSLIDEFSAELAVIKGRVDGLDSGLDQFEAGVFSSTTKLSGKTTFVIGAVDSPEDQTDNDAVHFIYDTKIALDTSFNGDDLLKTVLRTGNGGAGSPFGSQRATHTPANTSLEVVNSNLTADQLTLARNYYQFPVGDSFTATIGAKVRQDDMLAVWPSSYPGDSVLDVLTYAGANDAYALALGAGAGMTWSNDNWAASLLFVSTEATDARTGGVLTGSGDDDITAQVAYLGDNYTIAAVWTGSDGGVGVDTANANDYEAFGLSGDWQIDSDSAFIPSSVSGGMGWKSPDNSDDSNDIEDETTWTLGFQWEDAFVDGNTLGVAVGSAEGHRDDSGYDNPLAYEIFYSMAVTDNITVTPALFIIEKNKPSDTSLNSDSFDDVIGALVKTTFRF